MVRTLGGLFAVFLVSVPAWAADEQYIKVEIKGTFKSGIVAIGGETTGATITANKVTWEVDLSKNKEARAAAEKLSGKQVIVHGSYHRKPGVEIRERHIVVVESLKAAD